MFTLSAIVAPWLTMLGLARFVSDPGWADLWYRHAITLQALTGPAIYALAVHLTGAPRRRLVRLAWAAGLLLAAWGLTTSRLYDGLRAVGVDDAGTLSWWVGSLFVSFKIATVGGALLEFVHAYRIAPTETDRNRNLGMLIAMGIGALTIADYFFPWPRPGAIGLSPLTVTGAVAIIGLVQTRYRAFAPDSGFAAEEVVRTMGDAVLVCDEAGTVRIANPEAARLLGHARAALVGRPISDVLAWSAEGEHAGPVRPVEVQEFAGGRIRDRAMALVPQAGDAIPVRATIEPLRRPGLPRGWVIVARDIRERIASDEALKKSEIRYRSLFWHNPAAAYEVSPDGRIASLNPAAERLLDVPAHNVVGQSFERFVAPEDRAQAGALIDSVLAGEPRESELTALSASGERRSLRCVSIPVYGATGVAGVFGVALDVSEEIRVKRELEVQRRYFEELFESSPEAIALIDEEGRVRRVNHEFTRLFGYRRNEAVGRELDELIVPEEDREEGARLGRLATAGRLTRAELVRRRKEGGLIEVSLLARRIQIPGEDVQVYACYRDVTDRKRTEEKLREREDELRHAQRLEAVGKLAGGIAHDFNNLLTVINGHARVLLDELDPADRLRGDLEEIERSGIRAASLTQQLLAFSRRQVLRPETLALNDVVHDIERMLRRLIGSHIRLETELTTGRTTVVADRGQVEQVIMNLVVNARDAMPQGGTLVIRTGMERLDPGDPRIEQWDASPGTYVRLEVEDDGAGMTPQVLARAFDPFFTTKEQGKGTGLGLATVFGIVKQSGGHVSAESKPGTGTRILVYLPAATGPGAAKMAPLVEPVPSDHASGHTILIVEDEPSVRNLAVRVLKRRGYEVIEAGDGAEALELARSMDRPIDLLLSDLVMPRMGGRELARRMRALRPDTAILLMSGYDDEMVSGQIGEGDDFLPKPFTPADLASRVSQLLAASRE